MEFDGDGVLVVNGYKVCRISPGTIAVGDILMDVMDDISVNDPDNEPVEVVEVRPGTILAKTADGPPLQYRKDGWGFVLGKTLMSVFTEEPLESVRDKVRERYGL